MNIPGFDFPPQGNCRRKYLAPHPRATAITLLFAAVEAGVGWRAGSLPLVADPGHMVSDAGSLALAAAAAWVERRPPLRLHSYDFGRVELFAGLANSLGLPGIGAWHHASPAPRQP